MTLPFSTADWRVIAGYILLLVAGGWIFTPRSTGSAREYFLAGGSVPSWLAAVSVLSATQSAATFLGGPDYGYHGDLTYLSGNIDKLRLFDLSLDLSRPFSMLAIVTGLNLLYIANAGMDQDTTQRLLACRDAKAGARSLYLSVLGTVPVVGLFIVMGLLLYVFYDRPDLMGGATAGRKPLWGREGQHLHALHPDPTARRPARIGDGRDLRGGGGHHQFGAQRHVLGADSGFLSPLA